MGVKYEDLEAIIDFLYTGEANVSKENLDHFLSVAEDLKLNGLAREEAKQNYLVNLSMTMMTMTRCDSPPAF